ncbi:MAG TPA: response regulator [Vicinamibacterales bacterium]|nr:response regulator [Vicinamibacterales bacterium]
MQSGAVKVLIVDDDDAYARYVGHVFARTMNPHLELVHVRYLRDVLPAIEEHLPSVVLIDVHLPDGDGLEWMRQHRSRVRAAVIVLTSYAELSEGADVTSVAQDFLVKSEVEPPQLVRAVRYAIDRERSRQQLLRSREYFQSLIEQVRDLITVVDDRGIVLYQGPASTDLLGLPPEALVGRPIFELMAGRDVERARELLKALFDGRDTTPRGEFDVYHTDGTVRTLEVVASRLPSVGDSPRAVLNGRDITERRRTEEALRGREEELRQAQKMEAVGRLAGGIAHDFSNLLTVITAACERMRDRAGHIVDLEEDVETILRTCARGAALTRQLLAFSRQQMLSPQPIDLAQLVAATGSLVKQLIGEHIQLEIDVPTELPAVEADSVQMQQVLMNLAINARDAMPGGGLLKISVRSTVVTRQFAEKHPPMPPGDYVMLEVSDTGHGMTAETRAHAFEPFFTTKDPSQGTGLGLATVYGIVKQSGGYVWIDSEPGAGATVRVFLPPTHRTPVAAEIAPVKPAAPIRPATILLAEDEDDVRELVYDMLVLHGFEVLAAATGAEALERAQAYPGRIDLLLTDVVMPGGTGRDLAERIRAIRPETKVLYISGYPEHGSPRGSVLEPGTPFLAKPFTRDLLLDKIRTVLA